jgi:exodeoxyribonuclease VII large subunit
MSEQIGNTKRSIRETNGMIRALIEQETLGYPHWIGGYVSRYFLSDKGHIYFDLNDEGFSVGCMIREVVRGSLDFTLNNGMDVEVYGSIRVYEKSAKVQIDVEKIRLIERSKNAIDPGLIQQLEKKGLWPRNKLSLPEKITQIGLVTSKQSEALHDFEDTYRQENGTAVIKLIDVRLQGQQAPREIADAINRFNHEKQVDVIVLIRGGGRASELAIFDDYLIAEAVCRSSIPVITGIGHQRNETFADLAADVSTITPTAAAHYLAESGKSQIPIPQQSPVLRWRFYLTIGLIGLLSLIIFLLIANR